MTVIYAILMLAALGGMIFCSKKQKTNPAMQPIAFVLLVVVCVAGFFLMKEMGVFGSSNNSLLSNEMKFYASQGYKAGKVLSQNHAGKKLLIITDPGFDTNENIKGLVDQVKAGFGSDNVVVDTIALPGNQGDSPMPLFMMMKAKDFDAVVEKYKDAQVIISTIGLPSDAGAMKFWKMKDRPALFLIGMPASGLTGLPEALANGAISGIIISSPNAKYDVSAPSDMEKAFDIRYVVVDKSNFDQFKQYFGN